MRSRYSVTPTISGRPSRPILRDSWYDSYQSTGIFRLAATSGWVHVDVRATPTPPSSSRTAFALFVAHWLKRYAASLFRLCEETARAAPKIGEKWPPGPAGRRA